MIKISAIIFLILLIFTSLAFADYKYLERPPITLENPFYGFYKGIINKTLKLPLSAFTKTNILVRTIEENLYNLSFALETKMDYQNIVKETLTHMTNLEKIIQRWSGFTKETSVKNKLKEIQINIFKFTLAFKYEPLYSLNSEDLKKFEQILRSISDAIYNLLGSEESLNNLKEFSTSIPIEDFVFLLDKLFSNKIEIANQFPNVVEFKVINLTKDKDATSSLEEMKVLVEKFLPQKSPLRKIFLEIIENTKKLNDAIQLIDENKVFISDTEKFQELYEKFQEKFYLTKELILKNKLEETLPSLNELKKLLEEMNKLFVYVEKESPVIKEEKPKD
jgi:cob(I)alamin adenosyltransferase